MSLDTGPFYTTTGSIPILEYAQKAADQGSTVIALKTSQGIIFCIEKIIDSKLYQHDQEKKHFLLKKNILMTYSGLIESDIRAINSFVSQQMGLANDISKIGSYDLKNAVCYVVGVFGKYYGCRPPGISMLYCHGTEQKLFVTQPSSLTKEVYAYAIGKGSSRAKTELEKLSPNLSLNDGIRESIKIMFKSFDPLKDKPFKLDVLVMNETMKMVDREYVQEIMEEFKDLNMDDE